MKTAIQELLKRMKDDYGIFLSDNVVNEYIQKEKEQIIKACIKTTKDCWISNAEYLGLKLEFKEQDLKDQKNEAEQYYDETFNK